MKETIKNGILLFLVIVFAIFFASTRGNDELNLNFEFPSMEEEFSYPIVASEYNGLYRNNGSNGSYAMVGKNPDGTYRIYFIYAVSGIKNIVLKLDSARVENGKVSFTDTNNVKLSLNFGKNDFDIPKELGMGNAQLEGYYLKTKDLNTFAMSEFKY